MSAEIAVPGTAEVEAEVAEEAEVVGSSVFGFVMVAEESGTGPAEKAARWSVYLEQHSGVSEELTLGP